MPSGIFQIPLAGSGFPAPEVAWLVELHSLGPYFKEGLISYVLLSQQPLFSSQISEEISYKLVITFSKQCTTTKITVTNSITISLDENNACMYRNM